MNDILKSLKSFNDYYFYFLITRNISILIVNIYFSSGKVTLVRNQALIYVSKFEI